MKTFAPKSYAPVSLALISALAAGMSLAACSSESSSFKSEATGGDANTGGGDNQGGDASTGGGEASGGSDASGGNSQTGGAGGDVTEPECSENDPCQSDDGSCTEMQCVEGACVEAVRPEATPCDGGSCNASGVCVVDTCSTGAKDGAETDVDCGGPCAPCADSLGCDAGSDCVSGVCTNDKCAESDCDDGVKNGTETDVDCGGTCTKKCALDDACTVTADCAVAAGALAESVRCLDSVCTSTKPPGSPRYWQDFHSSRRVHDTGGACHATDDYCLYGANAAYQMRGIDANGAARSIGTGFMNQAGVIGNSGEFDGNFCVLRDSTNLSVPGQAAFTVMAWVNDRKTAAPWQSGVANGTNFGLAIDSNSSAQRFLASLRTDQKTLAYQNATTTGQVPSNEWHHVAEVYSNAGAKMIQYVDGVEVKSTEVTGNTPAGSQNTYIGCAGAKTQMFKGLLDEVVIYTSALSAAEIADYVRRTAP